MDGQATTVGPAPVIRACSRPRRVGKATAVHIRWIEEVFAARLGDDRELRLAQLVAILDVWTWQVLRRERGLSPDDTRRALEGLVASVG